MVVVVVMGHGFLFFVQQGDNSWSIPGHKSRKEVKVHTLLFPVRMEWRVPVQHLTEYLAEGKRGPTPVDSLHRDMFLDYPSDT